MYKLEGKRFGILVATNKTRRKNGCTKRLCYCKCGKAIWTRTTNLMSGHTKTCGCSRTIEIGKAARNSVLNNYKYSATIRGLSWRLTNSQFDLLTNGPCFFCGRSPNNIKKTGRANGRFVYNGIDRLNNKFGYTKTNVVSCCNTCNKAKRDMTLTKFLSWIKAIKKHKIHLHSS